jgi:hypothetical protein
MVKLIAAASVVGYQMAKKKLVPVHGDVVVC